MNSRGNDRAIPEGPDGDLVWMTPLHGQQLDEELPEELLFERPEWNPLATGQDEKLTAVVLREDAVVDCE